MSKISTKMALIAVAITLLARADRAYAIPPPDVIFQVASQIGSFLAIGLLMCSAILSLSYQLIKSYAIAHKKNFWVSTALLMVVISFTGAYYFDRQNQQLQQEILTRLWENRNVRENGIKSSPLEQNESPAPTLEATKLFSEPETVSSTELKTILASGEKNFILLDAREAIEFELGQIPESNHIRFADLTAGKWKELPADIQIYVVCWSGIRGKEVTDFLRSKGLSARFLEKGVSDWVAMGGEWIGEYDFYKVFHDNRYNLLFTEEQAEELFANGAIALDSRIPKKAQLNPLFNALLISTLHTPSDELQEKYAQVASGKQVITLCDDLVSCFDATLTGVELERRGVEFLGKYSVPQNL